MIALAARPRPRRHQPRVPKPAVAAAASTVKVSRIMFVTVHYRDGKPDKDWTGNDMFETRKAAEERIEYFLNGENSDFWRLEGYSFAICEVTVEAVIPVSVPPHPDRAEHLKPENVAAREKKFSEREKRQEYDRKRRSKR